jgi:hypothetical protein
LHPAQAALVARDFAGPARVSGSAGTGKTIVAPHRAAHLARANDAKVLLTTFSNALANALKGKLTHLVSHEPQVAGRIVVRSITSVGYDLHTRDFGPPNIAPAFALTHPAQPSGGRGARSEAPTAISFERVGRRRRRLATDELGRLRQCPAPRAQNTAGRNTARATLDDLRARPRRPRRTQGCNLGGRSAASPNADARRRARDQLLVTGLATGSEFLADGEGNRGLPLASRILADLSA